VTFLKSVYVEADKSVKMKTLLRSNLIAACIFLVANIHAQTPILNSYPSATATIFLDFDGHTVNGTSWNFNGPIYCGPSGLSATEVTRIFDRVAEDYRPFDINVTTDSTYFLNAPLNRRIRVILTVTSDWYGSAGGVAYINSFSWGDDTPCFIFTQLLNYNLKYISEATAHEAGHTLGLRHQSAYDNNCVKVSDYSYGQGTGEIGWAPIMGVGYYQNFTLWHNGPNPYGCTNFQNDLEIITSAMNGISFRNDDHTNDFTTATPASFSNNQFIASGIIEKSDDKDFFTFTIPFYGQFRLDAIPYNVGTSNAGSDVDLQIQIANESQVILGTYNPGTLLGSFIDTFLNAGTYYLMVDGKQNQYAPEYGSLGSYSLQGNLITGDLLPLRKLELKGILIQEKHQLSWIIEADEEVVKQVLEVSTDGRNFSALYESPGNSRSFVYTPNTIGIIQYRLNVTFNNGHQYYSNIVAIRQHASSSRPRLLNNPVSSNVISISSVGTYTYLLYDINGKEIKKGKIINGINKIEINNLARGMHMLRFTDGKNYWVEKLIRQ
jgi:hypothetical protein